MKWTACTVSLISGTEVPAFTAMATLLVDLKVYRRGPGCWVCLINNQLVLEPCFTPELAQRGVEIEAARLCLVARRKLAA